MVALFSVLSSHLMDNSDVAKMAKVSPPKAGEFNAETFSRKNASEQLKGLASFKEKLESFEGVSRSPKTRSELTLKYFSLQKRQRECWRIMRGLYERRSNFLRNSKPRPLKSSSEPLTSTINQAQVHT